MAMISASNALIACSAPVRASSFNLSALSLFDADFAIGGTSMTEELYRSAPPLQPPPRFIARNHEKYFYLSSFVDW